MCNTLVPMSDTWRCLVEPTISSYNQRTNESQSERVCESRCQEATFSCVVILKLSALTNVGTQTDGTGRKRWRKRRG